MTTTGEAHRPEIQVCKCDGPDCITTSDMDPIPEDWRVESVGVIPFGQTELRVVQRRFCSLTCHIRALMSDAEHRNIRLQFRLGRNSYFIIETPGGMN